MLLKAGTINDYIDSMAAEMSAAFLAAWNDAISDQPAPTEVSSQMRLLFVAVAQGVVKHLYATKDSFVVQVKDGSNTYTGNITDINTDPTPP